MATKKKTVEEILAETNSKWICPITNKVFDSNDSAQIEIHKKALIKKEKDQLEKVAAKKELIKVEKVLKKNMVNVSSLVELNDNVKITDFMQKLKEQGFGSEIKLVGVNGKKFKIGS